MFATKSCASIELRMGRGVVRVGSSVMASAPGLLADSSRLLCGVWLVMVEIEEVPVQILYGELP